MSTLFEVSAADVAWTTDDYYTPPWLFDAAGLLFDVDVAAPLDPMRRTCPARRYLTLSEDGLSQPWDGLVWMNPPFSNTRPWVERFAAHRSGLALLPALQRTWMEPLLGCADAVTLVSPKFGRPDGRRGDIMPMLILVACGEISTGALARVAAADKYAGGAYHVRPPAALGRFGMVAVSSGSTTSPGSIGPRSISRRDVERGSGLRIHGQRCSSGRLSIVIPSAYGK